MRAIRLLPIVAALLICTSPGWAITFTGNVDVDFTGIGIQSFPDSVPDAQTGLAGCDDQPLGQNSFQAPLPDESIIPASGFNLERVVTLYDCETDTLYVGLDTCDPRIAWDVDNNDSILAFDPNVVPGFTLIQGFTDLGLESYRLDFNFGGGLDLRIVVQSLDGGTTAQTLAPIKPAAITVAPAVSGSDVELMITGVRAAFPTATSFGLQTVSGSDGDGANEDITSQTPTLPCPCIAITKQVACLDTGPWAETATVLRGAPVWFKVVVTNCGNITLSNVTITDALTGVGYLGGQPTPPAPFALPAGQSYEWIFSVPTDPAFPTMGGNPDFTNTASVSGEWSAGQLSGVVNAGPDTATVNILVPSITCEKWAADNAAMDNPTHDLQFTSGTSNQAWFKLCVTNNGETAVSFVDAGQSVCPDFWDPKLETADPDIPGTGVDVDALLLAQIPGGILAAGQTACITVGPLTFTSDLCDKDKEVFTNEFKAYGLATSTDTTVCLPPVLECVNTGAEACTATVSIPCQPEVCITKEVSCYENGPWAETATVLRGATAWFKVVVTNCGKIPLTDVTITDTLSGVGYLGGQPTPPAPFALAVGQSYDWVFPVQTDPTFATKGGSLDFTNTASVSAQSAGGAVNAGPDTATVDILVPSIACEKSAGQADTGPFVTGLLDLSGDGPDEVETVYFKLCITNDGEVDVDFSQGTCMDHFVDPFLENTPTVSGVTGPPFDIDGMFLAALGGSVLPAGQSVCIVVGPVLFDEAVLCPAGNSLFINTFQACGLATKSDICLPPAGGEDVSTGECTVDIKLCTTAGAARTPGYWMTHGRQLQYALNQMSIDTGGAGYTLVNLYKTFTWPDMCAVIGDTAIPNINNATCAGKLAWQLMAVEPGHQPTPNLHVAAILEFQLVASLCNEAVLGGGGIVVDGTTMSQLIDAALLLTADCMISDDEIDEALHIADLLDQANNDPIAHNNPFPEGFPTGKALPKMFVNKNCP